jgi:hypothetical protein
MPRITSHRNGINRPASPPIITRPHGNSGKAGSGIKIARGHIVDSHLQHQFVRTHITQRSHKMIQHSPTKPAPLAGLRRTNGDKVGRQPGIQRQRIGGNIARYRI